jgi:AGCS family alanine or glycine:cation symporter
MPSEPFELRNHPWAERDRGTRRTAFDERSRAGNRWTGVYLTVICMTFMTATGHTSERLETPSRVTSQTALVEQDAADRQAIVGVPGVAESRIANGASWFVAADGSTAEVILTSLLAHGIPCGQTALDIAGIPYEKDSSHQDQTTQRPNRSLTAEQILAPAWGEARELITTSLHQATTEVGADESPDAASSSGADPKLEAPFGPATTTDATSVPAAPESSSPASSAAVGETPSTAMAEANSSWMTRLDQAFGTYVVNPLAAVLFFDFYTSRWLGASIPFVVAWLFLGAIFFTFRMGLINVRAFWHAVCLTRGDYDSPHQAGEVTHLQALASALSATVGLGNIAGVAIAVGTGGPGATFWMIVCGFLGMTSKFTECTLGMMYRKVQPDGTVLGGPMEYLQAGLADLGYVRLGKCLSVIFAVFCIGASFGGGNAFQVGQSLGAIRQDIPLLDQQPWIYGLFMAFMSGLVILGGIRSIGAVSARIVPIMCLCYLITVGVILLMHLNRLPAAIGMIFTEAFTPQAAYGGFLGVVVTGIRRAVFSNEAGVGSAAIAHSAAKSNEPVSEGVVALLEPFIDTVMVCTMTALVIIVTGVYNDPAHAQFVINSQGAALTKAAFTTGGYEWFKWILYAVVVLFAYSTLISWSYYGERCTVSLFGQRSSRVYKIAFLLFVVLGSIVTESNSLAFSDLLILSMSLPNIFGLYFLSGRVKRALDQYWGRYLAGELVAKRA